METVLEKHDKKDLEEWIEGYTALPPSKNLEICAEASSHDVGLASTLIEASIIALRDTDRNATMPHLSKENCWEQYQLHDLRSCLENLYLWSQSVCPLQRSLGESQSLHETVLECLYNIGIALLGTHPDLAFFYVITSHAPFFLFPSEFVNRIRSTNMYRFRVLIKTASLAQLGSSLGNYVGQCSY